MRNSCMALVVACMDYRFQAPMYRWLRDRGLEGRYDLICFPGASKDLAERKLADLVQLAVDLHDITEVYLVHHEDCGAYRLAGWEGERQIEIQQRDMRHNATEIKKKYPQLKVGGIFFRLNDEEPEEWLLP